MVAGALFSALAIARLMKVRLSLPTVLALCLAVWVVYTFDHLIDAHKISHIAHTPRHRFHQKYWKSLAAILVFLSLVGVGLMFIMPFRTILVGLIVSSVTLVYFLALRLFNVQSAFQKELFISLVYVMGVFTGPLSQFEGQILPYHFLLFFEYLLLAFTNLVLFAWYEQASDMADGHSSLVLKVGLKGTHALLRSLYILCSVTVIAGLLIWSLGSLQWHFQWIMFSMLVCLLIPYLLPGFFNKNERYRVIGDGAFLLPGLLLLI
ncbi:hypothetical protein AB9P05_08075 [Roseivirga sp. BDSF3-8]|uniref:hypothetical protein n=1 Tax=Roseivirga sp. BDSF3-8 TaxID=3241598 RepID=UPI003531848D